MQEITDKLEFQTLDWDEYQHVQKNEDDGDCDSNDGKNKMQNKIYIVRLFGKTKDQKSVYLEVTDFKPYFYIEIKSNWTPIMIHDFMDKVKENVFPKQNIEGLIKYEQVKKCRFYGFTNYTKFTFLQLNFQNIDCLKSYERALKKIYNIPSISKKPIKTKIYESNLLPMLRLMHINKMNAVGTISVKKEKLNKYTILKTCCDYNFTTSWKNIEAIEEHMIEKYVILAFDIECTSIDGSFPQAEREGDKIIQIGMTLSRYGEDDCYDKYLLSLGETADIDGVHVKWYETEEELLLGFAKYLRKLNPDIITGYNIFGFDWAYIKGRIEKLKSIMISNGKNAEATQFENKAEKLTRIEGEKSFWKEDGYPLSSGAMGVNLFYFYKMTGRVQIDLMKVAQRDFKLSSYKLDYVASNFIRDNILDITKLENKKVLHCDTKVTSSDSSTQSDFVTGDVTSIKKSKKNNNNNNINNKIKEQFKIMTKSTFGIEVGNFITVGYFDGAVEEKYGSGKKFKVIELDKSSITVEGEIDTTEFMGKDYKIFWTQAKDDITPQDIFTMCNGTPEERAIIGKYCVQDCALCNKLMAKLQIITNNVGMANVCHVPLSFLFLRGQGIKIFSLVAKKCREKNHLIPLLKKPKKDDIKDKNKEKKKDKDKDKDKEKGKDKIITVDEMNDREIEKHIENLAKKNNENDEEVDDEEDDKGYEGAIVFIPKPGVYFEPIPVLDYASLYPNSMRLRNLSHECFVDDEAYDNLPDYKYHTITYKNNNGTFTTCKFAENRNGTKGIIPEILTDLLNARKKYKKLMEAEPDYFKKSVLDGLQLAYKVTANSLYGQTGASTSDIRMKEIAASTTATGREMLQFSKHFIENMYAELLNKALENKDDMIKLANNMFKYFPTTFDIKDNDNNNIQIHINTENNEKIPDSKFIRKEIGYEIDFNYAKELKKNSNYENLIKQIFNLDIKSFETNIKNKDTNKQYEKMFSDKLNAIFDFDKILEKLYDISPILRKKFLEKFKKSKIKKDFYEKYKNLFEDMSDYNQLKEKFSNFQKWDLRDIAIKNLEISLDDMGYKNKEQFFEKFYITMSELLDGYSVEPEIIYGDSVTGDMPLLLQDENGRVFLETIENLGKQWKDYIYGSCEKMQDTNINYKVWSNEGWTKINRVIKHKTNKKIYEVFTKNSCVKVTEDHSLLNEYSEIIKPKQCDLGTKLLQSFPDVTPAELTNWNINFFKNFDTKLKTEFNKEYIYLQSKYLTLKQGSYKPQNLTVQKLGNEYRLLKDNLKCLTEENIIHKIEEIKYEGEIWVYDLETENHHFQAGIGEIIVHNTDSVFFCPHIRDNETGELLKNHNALCMCIRLGIWASILITTMLPTPMAQEYEKVLWPFIIQGKKRYVGNLYEKNPNSFKQKSMGIELKRRDNAPIVKTVSAGIINKIVNERNPEGAFEFMQDILEKIIRGKFNMDKFIITKTLKGNALTKKERIIEAEKPKEERSYNDRTSIVHAVLADRIADRDPGNKPLSNDRIPYAYIETPYEPKLQGDKAETPEYIIENNLKLDYLFYITNQIMKPALKFLDLVSPNAGELFNDYITREKNRRNGLAPISYYAEENEDEEEIFNNKILNTFENNSKSKKTKTTKNKKRKIDKKEISDIVLFDDL